MNKYKQINSKTGEEYLCDKVTIDGFDYYVSDEIIKDVRPYYGKWQVEEGTILNKFPTYLTDLSSCRLVIATNNPNIDDVPKVVDEVEMLGEDETNIRILQHKTPSQIARQYFDGFIKGYNKSQETHPFSEEDIRFMLSEAFKASQEGYQITSDEIIQLWKEQKPKIVYYE